MEKSQAVALNTEMADQMQHEFGYSPSPTCDHCKGFGRVHPVKYNGETDWGHSVMCQQPGCLGESFRHRYQGR